MSSAAAVVASSFRRRRITSSWSCAGLVTEGGFVTEGGLVGGGFVTEGGFDDGTRWELDGPATATEGRALGAGEAGIRGRVEGREGVGALMRVDTAGFTIWSL